MFERAIQIIARQGAKVTVWQLNVDGGNIWQDLDDIRIGSNTQDSVDRLAAEIPEDAKASAPTATEAVRLHEALWAGALAPKLKPQSTLSWDGLRWSLTDHLSRDRAEVTENLAEAAKTYIKYLESIQQPKEHGPAARAYHCALREYEGNT